MDGRPLKELVPGRGPECNPSRESSGRGHALWESLAAGALCTTGEFVKQMMDLLTLAGSLCASTAFSFPSQAQYPNLLSRARGQGTFCAIDICNDATRNSILLKARDKGKTSLSTICCLKV